VVELALQGGGADFEARTVPLGMTVALMTENHIGDLDMGLDLGIEPRFRFGLGLSVAGDYRRAVYQALAKPSR